jgi:hypothetical protein
VPFPGSHNHPFNLGNRVINLLFGKRGKLEATDSGPLRPMPPVVIISHQQSDRINPVADIIAL